MTIKHLVISGGGPTGFVVYGALRELAKKEFWSLEHIESIYGTSVGSFIGVIISLGYEWEWIDDYLTKRPWSKVADLNPMTFVEAFHKKGIVDESVIHESIAPLFTAKDLPADITLAGLYEATQIDTHIFTTEINGERLTKVDLSHTTHPDLVVSRAIAMSAAFPFVFCPVCVDGKCYIDGGMVNNFPLEDCFEQKECDKSEVLAFKNIWKDSHERITNESTMVDFLSVLIRRMKVEVDMEPKQRAIEHIVKFVFDDMNGFDSWVAAAETEEMRLKLVNRGVIQADIFLEYLTQRCE